MGTARRFCASTRADFFCYSDFNGRAREYLSSSIIVLGEKRSASSQRSCPDKLSRYASRQGMRNIGVGLGTIPPNRLLLAFHILHCFGLCHPKIMQFTPMSVGQSCKVPQKAEKGRYRRPWRILWSGRPKLSSLQPINVYRLTCCRSMSHILV
jgi:hypothetical protein